MLRQLIDNIIQCERSLDNIRNQLSQDTLFSIKPIMSRLDQCDHGFIDTEDLISFCSDNDIQCTHREAYYALKYLDQNKDGKVTFDDLAKQLLPKSNRDARLLTALREPYNMDKKMYLPEQIESGLSIFFGELLLHIREQQSQKQQLLKDFNIYKLFYDISKNQEYIQIEEFAEYFHLTLVDAQVFFQAAQQQSDTQLGCIELMDILLNSDSVSIEEYDVQVQNSPLKVNPFQNQDYKKFQNIASPRFTTEKQPKYNQDTVETIKESHDSSKFVDEIALQLEKDHPNSMIVNTFEQVDDQDIQKLFNYILKAIHQLKILDDSKRPLVMRSDFNPMTLFSLFDSRGQGVINIDNLVKGLKLFNIKRNQQELQLLLKQYGDGTYIKYSYFIKMISSILPEFQLQQQQSFQKISTPKQAFNPTTIDYIKSLFELLLETEIKFIKLRADLGLQTETIYSILDYDEKGSIEESDFKIFLNQLKTYPTPYELRLLTTRINFNIQTDRINKDVVIEYFSI